MASPLLWLAACALAAAAPEATPPVSAAPCIACRAPAVELHDAFSETEWVALEDGEVLRDDSAARSEADLAGGARAESLIARSPAQVWSVLTDFERWPDFMPLVEKTQVARREGPRLWVAQQFSILFVSMGHTTIYDLDTRDGRLSWHLDDALPHDIASSQGSWQLLAVDGGHETLVRYAAEMRAGRGVPDFVESWLRERSLEKLLTSLRGEVLRRYPEP